MLAYHLLTAIEKTLLDHGTHTSWATVRDTLKSHQICTVVLPTDDGSTLRIRKAATPEPEVEDLYRALANYQKLKAALEAICELNHQLLRGDDEPPESRPRRRARSKRHD